MVSVSKPVTGICSTTRSRTGRRSNAATSSATLAIPAGRPDTTSITRCLPAASCSTRSNSFPSRNPGLRRRASAFQASTLFSRKLVGYAPPRRRVHGGFATVVCLAAMRGQRRVGSTTPIMLGQILAKVIGTQNEREIKRLRPLVTEISALEPQIQALTDEQLRQKTE